MNEHGGRFLAVAGIAGCVALAVIVGAILSFEFRGKAPGDEVATKENRSPSEAEEAKPHDASETPEDSGEAVPISSDSVADDDPSATAAEDFNGSPESKEKPTDDAADSVEPAAPASGKPKSDPPTEKPPWASVLDNPAEPPPFSDICFDDFDTSKSIPLKGELEQWFENVSGKPGSISTARSRAGQCGSITGLLRLKSPWNEETALRLSLENYNQLRIHFFYGRQGITLAYYESDHYRWAAYATTREDESVTPETFALAATDDGRNRRTEIRFGGPFEIRYRAGELVLSRGDIVLLRAPLGGPPQQVYFEGKAYFQGIALVRDRDFPAASQQTPPTLDHDELTELDWESNLGDKASFSKDSDGSVTLSADKTEQRGWVVTKMPDDGIYEVTLHIDQATPGTGVFLRCADGNVHEFVRFVENPRDKSLCITRRGADDTWSVDLGAIHERLVARAAPEMRIRLLYVCGRLRWWISSDGVHWAETHDYPAETPGNLSHVGIHHVARRAGCGIRLKRLSFRRLDRFAGLVDQAILQQAPTITDAPTIAKWLVRASERVPEHVEMSAWRRACALRTLGAGCSRQLGLDLVNRLLDDAASSSAAVEDRLDLLDEVAHFLNIRDDHNALKSLIARYHDAGWDAYRSEQRLPYSAVRRRLMEAPFSERLNLRVADPESIRIELLELLYSSHWQEAVEFCRRLRFFQQHQQVPLVSWAESVARKQLPRRFSGETFVRMRDQWRHPYEEELSKRTYNVLAELRALLDGEAYDDAARMIASIDPTSVRGVAPISDDRKLLVSLPAAVRLSVSESPQLQEVLVNQFGPLAELRVQQAIAAGDVSGVRLAAIQFGATPAAALAHRWLGDRALSGGWFAQAVAEYQRAERSAGTVLRAEIAPRIRLASAMLGQEAREPVSSSVEFGQFQLSADEFESLIQDMLKRESGAAGALGASHFARRMPETLPKPGGFKPQTRSRLDGAVGQQPNAETLRHVRRFQVPWVGRQIATVVEGDLLYASNRFQISAYDLNNGQRKWQSQNPPGKMLRSQEWSLTPMEPLVAGDRIYARLLFDKGPMLVCLEKQTGKLIWSAEQRSNEFIISDPLVIQGQLCCLALDRTDYNRQTVRLHVIAHDSGEVMRQEDLLQLRSSWWHRRYCRALAFNDSIVASFGGLTACFDLNGDSRWIRKQVNVPTEEEPAWVRQYFAPPRLLDGRLFIAEPSVRAIECVDPRTGRLIWSRTLPDIQRVVSLDARRLVIQVADGLLSLRPEDGEIQWRKHLEGLLHGVLASRDGKILLSRRVPVADRSNQFIPQLVWIYALDGKTLGQSPLSGFGEATDPRLGPLLEHKGKLWTFFGRTHDDPNRDFVELVQDDSMDVVSARPDASDPWAAHVPGELRIPSATAFSAWNLIGGNGGNQTGLLKSFHGNQAAPAVFGRRVQVPDRGAPKLRLRIGHPPGGDWTVEVRAGTEVISETDLEKQFPKQTWSDLEVDLSKLRGKLVWLTIHGRGVNPSASVNTLWKRIELVN